MPNQRKSGTFHLQHRLDKLEQVYVREESAESWTAHKLDAGQ